MSVYTTAAMSTPISQAAVDVSSGSAACNGVTTTPRTCIATVSLPSSTTANLGPYWFGISTYASAPVNGAFTTAAIGISAIANVTLTAGGSNQLSAIIAGIVSSSNVTTPMYESLPADGSAHQVALVLTPLDVSGNPVGTNDAPYANPLTVTLAESGGSGHTTLSVNGGAASNSATISRSTDSVVLHYDGGGSAGYTTMLTIAATGVAAQTLAVSPMYAVTSAPLFSSGAVNFYAASQSAGFTVSEANAPSSLGYTFTANGCTGIASVTPASSLGPTATPLISSGTTASAAGCTVTFADTLATSSTIAVNVTNATTGGTVGIPGRNVITEFTAGINGAAGVYGTTAGPDGNLWFAEFDNDKIGRITTSGVATEFSAIAGGNPVSITTGPDGNLWFTDLSVSKIGRITTGGVVTVFSSGISPVSSTEGIVAGPDGNLWFTERDGNRIGRITPAGVVTEFSAGITAGAGPLFIAAGPDGKLWFTEGAGNRIGSITTAGVVTEFPVPTGGVIPFAITSGPDGNLWFTEDAGNSIGRITTAGVVSEFPIPTSSAGGQFIAPGPDGNLWFTESHKIGRITTAGAITEFSSGISAFAFPEGITTGPDGNLWFGETGGIGRISP